MENISLGQHTNAHNFSRCNQENSEFPSDAVSETAESLRIDQIKNSSEEGRHSPYNEEIDRRTNVS